MISNKDLYNFNEEQNIDENPSESNQLEEPEFSFPSKLIYQTIIAVCCLIMILIISSSDLPWLHWASLRIHSAVNSSLEDTFGRISESQFYQTIVSNAGNLIRLEEITKNISGQDLAPRDLKVFQDSVWPVQGSIIKGFGWRYVPSSQVREFSSGVEIASTPDAKVLAITDGIITEITHQPNDGWQIRINHGAGWSSVYHYLGQVKVKVDQVVKTGDSIGQIRRPNLDKGPTLFLEVRQGDQPIDPLSVLVN